MSRSYVVGMPCLVTVYDDGRVVLDVDLTELDGAVEDAYYDQSGDDVIPWEVVVDDLDAIIAARASETPIIIEGRS